MLNLNTVSHWLFLLGLENRERFERVGAATAALSWFHFR